MNIQDMVNNGLMSYEEGRILANSRASASEASQNNRNVDFQENNGAKVNLLSAIQNVIVAVQNNPGAYSEEIVNRANEYAAYAQENTASGNLAELNLDRTQINSVLQDISALGQSAEYGGLIADEFALVAETAEIVSSGKSDEILAEEALADELESRHSEAPEPGRTEMLNPLTGNLLVADPNKPGSYLEDDGSAEFSQMYVASMNKAADQGYLDAMENNVSEQDFMAGLEER